MINTKRDHTDAIQILKYLMEWNPFDERTELLDIDTGEVAEDDRTICVLLFFQKERYGCHNEMQIIC